MTVPCEIIFKRFFSKDICQSLTVSKMPIQRMHVKQNDSIYQNLEMSLLK